MPRLPDLDNLGRRPTPRADLSIASVRNPDAISDAVGRFGETAAKIGANDLEREDRLSYAAAKTVVLKEDAQARQDLADDPDFATASKRYVDRMAKVRSTASGLIKSNADRRAFDVDTTLDVERGSLEVQKIVRTKERAAKTGLFASTLEDLQASARIATDDASREAAIKTAHDAIEGAQADGLVDPVKAVEMRRAWTNEYIGGQALSALDKGDIDKAKGIVEKFGKYLGTDTYLKISAAVNNEQSAQAVMNASSAGMGKPIVNAPSDVPLAIKKLFPAAEVTSFRRTKVEQAALVASGATAATNSHHLDGHAIDVRPIEGVAFADYVKTLKANGVNVIEALDETGKGKGQGTGAHWHIAWTDAPHAQPKTLEDAISATVAALGPNASVKQVDAARAETTKRWQVQKASEAEAEDDAVENAQTALMKNGGNWYALPVSVRNSVNPKYVPGLINYGEGLTPAAAKRQTDPTEYVRLTTMAQTDPKGFAAINPIEYRGKFDEGDWESLVGERAKILGKPDAPKEGPSLATIRSITQPMMDARGLTTTGIKGEQKTARQEVSSRIYNFEKSIAGDVEIWQRNNPGKEPTSRDIQEMADRRLLSAVQNGEDKFQFELTPGVAASIRIPAAARSRIASIGRATLGREPTDQEITQAYLREARGS